MNDGKREGEADGETMKRMRLLVMTERVMRHVI